MAFHDRFRRVFDERPVRSNSFDNIFDEAFGRFPRHAQFGYFPGEYDQQQPDGGHPPPEDDFNRGDQRSSFSTRGYPGAASSRFDTRFGPPPASMPPWARDLRHPYEERGGQPPRGQDSPDGGGYSNGSLPRTQWYRDEEQPSPHSHRHPQQQPQQPAREKSIKIEVERPDGRGRQPAGGGGAERPHNQPQQPGEQPRRVYFGQQTPQQQADPGRLHPAQEGGTPHRQRRSREGVPEQQPSPSQLPIPMPPPEPRPDNGIPIPMPAPPAGLGTPEASPSPKPNNMQPTKVQAVSEPSPEVKVVRRPENNVEANPEQKPQVQPPSVIQLDGEKGGAPRSPITTGRPSSPSPEPVPQVTRRFSRQASIGDVGDKIITMLDEIEKRVEKLRDTAALLEDEKRQLMDMLNTVEQNKDMLTPSSAREDIEAITSRLLSRCGAVNVSVSTPRNPVQAEALQWVNERVDDVLRLMREDIARAEDICRRYLNASSPDQPDGPIDSRFQSILIECTADDQKRVRKRLAQILDLMKADQPAAE